MSNLENITNKILAEAKQQAADIEAEAREFSDQYLEREQAKVQAQAELLIDRAKAEAEHKKNMLISHARLKSRDQELQAKQTVLAKTFELAKTALRELDDTQYRDFLTKTLERIDLKGSEQLIVPTDKYELVQAMGLELALEKDPSVTSGFQIQDHQTKLNFSFDDLVDEARDSMEGDIVKQLFSGEA